jgi:uncharacterized protein (TIGR02246 family)
MNAKYGTILAVLLPAVAIAGLTAVGWAQPPKQEPVKAAINALSKEDDQAVRKIVAGFEESWNAHDMKALAKLFREDAEWVNKVGMHWHGRDEIMVAHTAFHETIFKNHSCRTDAVETRSVAPGVAVAVTTLTGESFKAPDGRDWPKARNRISYVLTKGPKGWKIAHGHNAEIDEVAAKHDPVKKDGK